jgi:hypothetical protein
MRNTSTTWTRRAARVAVLALGVPVLMAAAPVFHVAVSHVGPSVQADAQWVASAPVSGNVTQV